MGPEQHGEPSSPHPAPQTGDEMAWWRAPDGKWYPLDVRPSLPRVSLEEKRYPPDSPPGGSGLPMDTGIRLSGPAGEVAPSIATRPASPASAVRRVCGTSRVHHLHFALPGPGRRSGTDREHCCGSSLKGPTLSITIRRCSRLRRPGSPAWSWTVCSPSCASSGCSRSLRGRLASTWRNVLWWKPTSRTARASCCSCTVNRTAFSRHSGPFPIAIDRHPDARTVGCGRVDGRLV